MASRLSACSFLAVLAIGVTVAGCHRKKTAIIEPYSLIPGGEPSGPVKVHGHDMSQSVAWTVRKPCVVPRNARGIDPVLDGPVIAKRKYYDAKLQNFDKPIRIPFIPMSPTSRPLLASGLLVLQGERALNLVLRSKQKVLQHRDVPAKFTMESETDADMLELSGLADAAAALAKSAHLDVAAHATPAVLYFGEDNLDESHRFSHIRAAVIALQRPRLSNGKPVFALSVQMAGSAKAKIRSLDGESAE